MTPPSRVLMTTDAVGGVWTYSLDLAAGLAEQGVATTLVVLGPSPSEDKIASARAIEGLDLIDTGLPLDWTAREPAEVLEVGAVVRGLARGARADLVHLNSPALAAGQDFAVPVLGMCHSCLATWWTSVKDGAMPPDFAWRTQALWRGLLACDMLAAPTAAFADATSKTYEMPTPWVVHNGRRPAATELRNRERLVFTSGRLWDEAKNVATLDTAATLGGVRLRAAGAVSGPGSQVTLSHAELLGELTPSQVTAQLQGAAIYASAALYEPFGLGVLEAAQAGCALVLSDIPSFRELWDGAALFAPARDAGAFAAAFERLLSEEDERRRLAAAAQARSRRYTVERMSAGVLDLYGRLLDLQAPPRRRGAAA